MSDLLTMVFLLGGCGTGGTAESKDSTPAEDTGEGGGGSGSIDTGGWWSTGEDTDLCTDTSEPGGTPIADIATTKWTDVGGISGSQPQSVSVLGGTLGSSSTMIVLAAPGDTVGSSYGAVYVVNGALPGSPASDGAAGVLSPADDDTGAVNFGLAIADAGDVDADGVSDVLVGDQGWYGGYDYLGREGQAYLFAGPFAGRVTTANATATFHGELQEGVHGYDTYQSYTGESVAGLGDVNGDGFGDVALTARGAGEYPATGAVYVLDGPLSGTYELGSQATARIQAYSSYVVGPGDLDGDGLADLLEVGGADYDDAVVGIFHGPIAGELQITDADTTISSVEAGVGNAFDIGDVDGDGHPDLAVQAADDDWGDSREAVVVVFGPFGATVDPAEATSVLLAASTYDDAGSSVAALGDLDGDGRGDFAIGASWVGYCHDDGEPYGAIYLIHGPADGVTVLSDAPLIVHGGGDDDRLGSSLASGDVDGDGLLDLFATDAGDDEAGEDFGAWFMISGATLSAW